MLVILRMVWPYLVALAIGFGVAWKLQGARYEKVRGEYATYKTGVETLGRAAQEAAAKQALHDRKNKERTDAEVKRAGAAHKLDVARVLDGIARGSYVPPAASAPGDTGRACFDRAELDAAVRDFARGTAGLVGEGSEAVIKLDALKEWRSGRSE